MFLNHFVYEKLGVYNKIIPQAYKPEHLGGKYDSRSILEKTLADATTAIQDVQDFSALVSTNDNIKAAQANMFREIIPYTFYFSSTSSQTIKQTMQSCVNEIVTEATEALRNNDNMSTTIMYTSVILNPTDNIDILFTVATDALTYLNSFIEDNYISTKLCC